MKKRCTNPACRRFFVADVVCPHCGKAYPRVKLNQEHNNLAEVRLIHFGNSKLNAVFVLHEHFRMSLLEAKHHVDACPTVVATRVSMDEAKRMAALLEKIGATVVIRRIS